MNEPYKITLVQWLIPSMAVNEVLKKFQHFAKTIRVLKAK